MYSSQFYGISYLFSTVQFYTFFGYDGNDDISVGFFVVRGCGVVVVRLRSWFVSV